MPKAKNDKRIIMYVSYPLKMKIGLFMSQNNVKSYSEFLRMATFFLMNTDIKRPKPNIWDESRNIYKKNERYNEILGDPIKKAHLEVMDELKELFKTGAKLLKKIE